MKTHSHTWEFFKSKQWACTPKHNDRKWVVGDVYRCREAECPELLFRPANRALSDVEVTEMKEGEAA